MVNVLARKAKLKADKERLAEEKQTKHKTREHTASDVGNNDALHHDKVN